MAVALMSAQPTKNNMTKTNLADLTPTTDFEVIKRYIDHYVQGALSGQYHDLLDAYGYFHHKLSEIETEAGIAGSAFERRR